MDSDSERENGPVVVYTEDKVNPVTLKQKWGNDGLSNVNQYTNLGMDVSKDSSWNTHIAEAMKNSK